MNNPIPLLIPNQFIKGEHRMDQKWFDTMEKAGLFERYNIKVSPCNDGDNGCYIIDDQGNKTKVTKDRIKDVFNI